jgi:hypothetical protein
MAQIGRRIDPEGLVSDFSTEQSRTKVLERLEASLTDQERALWMILKRQAERVINIKAAAAELDISRQIAHRHLINIRKKAKRLGLGDLL